MFSVEIDQLRTAAHRLALLEGSQTLSLHVLNLEQMGSEDDGNYPGPSKPGAGREVISALAPLDGKLNSLSLNGWTVDSNLLSAMAMFLPLTADLNLNDCFVARDVWGRLGSIASISRLGIHGASQNGQYGSRAEDVVNFALSCPRAMTLILGHNILPQFEWRTFTSQWETQILPRRAELGLPNLSILTLS